MQFAKFILEYEGIPRLSVFLSAPFSAPGAMCATTSGDLIAHKGQANGRTPASFDGKKEES